MRHEFGGERSDPGRAHGREPRVLAPEAPEGMIASHVDSHPRLDGESGQLMVAGWKNEDRAAGPFGLERDDPIGEEGRDPVSRAKLLSGAELGNQLGHLERRWRLKEGP